jgi:hypothetical protein
MKKIRREITPKPAPRAPTNASVAGGGCDDEGLLAIGFVWIFSGAFILYFFDLPIWLALILAIPLTAVFCYLLLGVFGLFFFLQEKIESLVE